MAAHTFTSEDSSQGRANVRTPLHGPTNDELELRTRQHPSAGEEDTTSHLRHDSRDGHKARDNNLLIGGSGRLSVADSASCCCCSEGGSRVSLPPSVAQRIEVGVQAVVVVCDNGSDAISVEGETSSRSTRGHLGVKAAPISRGHEAEGGRIADVHHQRKKTFDDIDITRSRVETNKCDELQVESRDGCEHEAILHIGEESSEKDIELPLQDQVKKLKEEIHRLKVDNLRFHLAEAMENNGSQPHDLHENASVKEKVGLLEVQLSMYQEDFANERQDRERAILNIEKLKDDVKILQNDLMQHKLLLEDMEPVIGIQTRICKQMLRESREALATTKAELEAAKEEIAVKVAQVKQYQKQVEAYKQQSAQHATSEEARIESCETVIIELYKGKPVERIVNDDEATTGARLLRTVSADACPDPHQSLDTGLNCVGRDEESSSGGIGVLLPSPNRNAQQPFTSPTRVQDTLNSGTASAAPVRDRNENQVAVPSPIPNPNQADIPSHVPVLNQSTISSQIPIPSRRSDQLPAAPQHDSHFVVGSVDDGSHLPPPILLPHKRLSSIPQDKVSSNWEKPCSDPQPQRASHVRRPGYVGEGQVGSNWEKPFGGQPGYVGEGDLCVAIDEDIHSEAKRVIGGATVSTLNTYPPLDPNLQCICCGRTFRKGEIQIFKKHMLECTKHCSVYV